jgi:hypothetical protein
MTDDIDSERLLLGLRGWPHPEWRGDYFPEDLPPDWEFAYYSNEAGCLLLPAADWLALDAETLEDWLDSCEDGFRFYLEPPAGPFPLERLHGFGDRLGGVLVDEPRCDFPEWVPLWQRARDSGHWVEHGGGAVLAEVAVGDRDLAALRLELQALPARTRALILGGGASASRLAEIRTLTELLEIA